MSVLPQLLRGQTRSYASKSAHAQWYSDVVPAMIPICLLGSAVYLGLQVTQVRLSHEKFMDEAQAHVDALEARVEMLQRKAEEGQNEKQTQKRSSWW